MNESSWFLDEWKLWICVFADIKFFLSSVHLISVSITLLCRFWIPAAVCWLLWAMVCGLQWCFSPKLFRHSSLQISATTMWRGTYGLAFLITCAKALSIKPLTNDLHLVAHAVFLVGNWCCGFRPGWCENCSEIEKHTVRFFSLHHTKQQSLCS